MTPAPFGVLTPPSRYQRVALRLLGDTMSNEAAGETDMGTTTKTVLDDATAHRNLVDEIWRAGNVRATREPGSWFLLAELARLRQGRK